MLRGRCSVLSLVAVASDNAAATGSLCICGCRVIGEHGSLSHISSDSSKMYSIPIEFGPEAIILKQDFTLF